MRLIASIISELVECERLSHEVVATEALLREHPFGKRPKAEVLIAEVEGEAIGFALYFSSLSTFLARPGIYLEDLYVRPAARGRGVGKVLLRRVVQLGWIAGAGGWSGACWTGTSRRSGSGGASGRRG